MELYTDAKDTKVHNKSATIKRRTTQAMMSVDLPITITSTISTTTTTTTTTSTK